MFSDNTEEKSQKDQVVTASKPSKPLLTHPERVFKEKKGGKRWHQPKI